MTPAVKRWLRAHGFAWNGARWQRASDGAFLAWNTSHGWRVHTAGCGFHPTEQPPS